LLKQGIVKAAAVFFIIVALALVNVNFFGQANNINIQRGEACEVSVASNYFLSDRGQVVLAENNFTSLFLYALSNYQKIIINQGNYSVNNYCPSQPLPFTQGIVIAQNNRVIEGKGQVTFNLNNTNSRILTVQGVNVEISNIIFDGQNRNVSPLSSDGLVVFEKTSMGLVENCTFLNGKNADAMGTWISTDTYFINNSAVNCQHGFVFSESSNCSAACNSVLNCKGSGFLIGGSFNCIFQGCICRDVGQNGFEITKLASYSYSNIIENCTGSGSGWYDLALYATSGNHISNSDFFREIQINESDHECTNNLFENKT
jgi:hypothetical protein